MYDVIDFPLVSKFVKQLSTFFLENNNVYHVYHVSNNICIMKLLEKSYVKS